MTVKEVYNEYEMSPDVQSRHRNKNGLESHKVGKQVFYSRRKIEAWIKAHDRDGIKWDIK